MSILVFLSREMHMASVRKRILKSGEVRWQVDYRDRDGARRHKQFRTKADAVTHETRVRTELAAGTHVADGASITVEGAGDLWLERADQAIEAALLGDSSEIALPASEGSKAA